MLSAAVIVASVVASHFAAAKQYSTINF